MSLLCVTCKRGRQENARREFDLGQVPADGFHEWRGQSEAQLGSFVVLAAPFSELGGAFSQLSNAAGAFKEVQRVLDSFLLQGSLSNSSKGFGGRTRSEVIWSGEREWAQNRVKPFSLRIAWA